MVVIFFRIDVVVHVVVAVIIEIVAELVARRTWDTDEFVIVASQLSLLADTKHVLATE